MGMYMFACKYMCIDIGMCMCVCVCIYMHVYIFFVVKVDFN